MIEAALNKTIVVNIACLILIGPYFPLAVKICLYSSSVLWLGSLIWKHGKRFPRHISAPSPCIRPMVLFMLAVGASVLASLEPYQSQKIFFSRYAGFFLAFFLGAAMVRHDRKVVSWLTGALVLSGLLVGIGGLWDYARLSPSRLFTSFGRDVNLSVLLSLEMPLLFALSLFPGNRILRGLSFFALLCLLPVFVLNYSRAVWIAVVLVVMGLLALKNIKWVPVMLVAILIGVFFSGHQVKSRIETGFHQEARVNMSRTALEIFEDFPVFGAGVGMFERLRPVYDPDPVNEYIHADNTYTELLAETGLIGLTTFCWIFVAFFKTIRRTLQRREDHDLFAIRLGLAGAVLSCLIVGFGTNALTVGFQSAVIFWLMLGFAAGLNPPYGEPGQTS